MASMLGTDGVMVRSRVCYVFGAGYEHPVDQVVEDLLSCLDDPALALLQWNEAFGVVQVGCMPTNLDVRVGIMHA